MEKAIVTFENESVKIKINFEVDAETGQLKYQIDAPETSNESDKFVYFLASQLLRSLTNEETDNTIQDNSGQ